MKQCSQWSNSSLSLSHLLTISWSWCPLSSTSTFIVTFKLEELILKCHDFVRLNECVELLKDMETKGLLDMTKVHTSFWLLLDILLFNFKFLLNTIFAGCRFIMPSFSTYARNKKLLKKLLITLGLFQIQHWVHLICLCQFAQVPKIQKVRWSCLPSNSFFSCFQCVTSISAFRGFPSYEASEGC